MVAVTATTQEEGFRAVDLAPHEFTANFLFVETGVAPFFAADRQVKAGEGSQQADFQVDDEQWQVTLWYDESNLVHPGGYLPTGTPWELEEMREFRLTVKRHPNEDPAGQQGFKAHLTPRWQGMKGERSDGTVTEIAVPDDVDEGVNVKIWGSNIEFDRYQVLLRRAVRAVGISSDYFAEPHPYSNVQDAEKYARVDEAVSGPVHARDGPLASMGHLLEHDRTGYRKTVQNDQNNRGNDLPGFYHTVTLDPRRIREAFPAHELPVEVKHYYAKEAKTLLNDDPLAHPKVGASYQVNRWDGKVGVTEDELADLEDELDRIVYSVLADAGINLVPYGATDGSDDDYDNTSPYVQDAYFDTEVGEQSVEPVELDLTRIRHEQESVVIRHVADGLSPVEWESLETLVKDGGQISPADIADQHGRHVESVRRALRRMDDLVDRDYAEVRLKSEYVAEMVHEAVEGAKDAAQRAVETTAKAMEAAERGLGKTMGTFVAWANRHGIDVDGAREARMVLRFNDAETHRERIRAIKEGLKIWTDAGMDPQIYRQAKLQFQDGSRGTAWHWLNG